MSLTEAILYNIQYPPKVLGQFVKLTNSQYAQNSIHPMQNNQFLAKNDVGQQTIWIKDQAQCIVGPDLDPYGLKRSLKSNIFLEIVGKYFHFVRELLEGTVYIYYEVVMLKGKWS